MAAWQAEVGTGTSRAVDYRDLFVKVVAFLTSQHVATVAVNSGGTGYTVGDMLTLTHAGAYLDARFEVLTVAAGVITSLARRHVGAFSNRAASATVSAGGTGYAIGDVLEVQGGTQREKAKFQVATLSGSAVATVALFETGGAYSATPSNPASTTKVGPAAGTGSGCTLTVTYSGAIGTTGLAVTGGTGTGATVDITLAQTGWTVDGRNTNSFTHNSLTNEKQVVLKGDAAGLTNKPYVGMVSWTETSGVNTRYGISLFGMVAHNSGIGFHQSPGISPGINTSTGVLQDGGGNVLCDENAAQEMDFWIRATDRAVFLAHNINSGAGTTDDGEYMHAHLGYLNSFGTEIENPYPMLVGASSRAKNIDPSAASQSISGIAECTGPVTSTPGWHWYRAEDSSWQAAENSEALATNQPRNHVMFPMGQITLIDGGVGPANEIVAFGPVDHWTGYGSTGRASPTLVMYPVPGSTPETFLFPLTLVARVSTSLNEVLDTVRGQVDGVYWCHATANDGTQIANFSEDTVTSDGQRHRVFGNHVHVQRYQYIAVEEAA